MSTSAASAAATGARRVMPTLFVSHGGGPSFFMEVPPQHPFFAISKESKNAQWLRDFMHTYRLTGVNKPKAIVVVSAHWETRGEVVRITNKEKHTKLYYDYGGFPRFTYEIEYNPAGSPALARRIQELLTAGGVKSELDSNWNFDHGVFVPLKMMVPDADIPIVEVSIDHGWDPAFHLRVGKALAQLKHEGVFVIGSGSSTHNFNPEARANRQFMSELEKLVEDDRLSVAEREKKTVLEWASIPSARKAHPAEDHFVPFFATVGAAGDQKARVVGKVEPAGDWTLASILFDDF